MWRVTSALGGGPLASATVMMAMPSSAARTRAASYQVVNSSKRWTLSSPNEMSKMGQALSSRWAAMCRSTVQTEWRLLASDSLRPATTITGVAKWLFAEVGLADLFTRQQVFAETLHHHRTSLEHVRVVAETQGQVGVLLDEED